MTNNEQLLIQIFSDISNTQATINLNTKIDDLDLDSMDVLDLLMNIENKLNIAIPIDQFSLCQDIESIRKIINQ
jgi:acyl carrier protein